MNEKRGKLTHVEMLQGNVNGIPLGITSGVIPVPDTAEVGQIIAIQAVDENGRLTAVEAVNMPETEIPSFDLNFDPVQMPEGASMIMGATEGTSEIIDALGKGAVTFNFPVNFNGMNMTVKTTVHCFKAGDTYQSVSAFYLDQMYFCELSASAESIVISIKPFNSYVEIPDVDGTETPVFDLATLGLSAVPLNGGSAYVETDTAAIREALAKGAATFVIPFEAGGETNTASFTMVGAALGEDYQCISVVNLIEPATVMVNVSSTAIIVVCSSIKEAVGGADTPPTSIDLSGFESEGRIVETFADGSTATTVMEFDANGKPTKITDGSGNVTVLTW